MSIWGVNQAPPSPVIITAGGDVACPAGTETNVLGGSVTVPTPGANFALTSDVMGVIVLGAVAPSALVVAARQGAGADYDSVAINAAALVANAILLIAPTLTGIFAKNSLAGGATINITVNPTGQAVTFKQTGRVVHTFGLAADA